MTKLQKKQTNSKVTLQIKICNFCFSNWKFQLKDIKDDLSEYFNKKIELFKQDIEIRIESLRDELEKLKKTFEQRLDDIKVDTL